MIQTNANIAKTCLKICLKNCFSFYKIVMIFIYFFILLQLYLFCGAKTQNFDDFQGFSVIRLTPKNQDQLRFIVNLTQNHQVSSY